MSEETVVDVSTPAGAQARLDQLSTDRDWGSKVLAKDAATMAEFHALSRTASAVDVVAPVDREKALSMLDAAAMAAMAGHDPELAKIAVARAGGLQNLSAEQLVAFSEQAAHEKLARQTIADARSHFEISPEVEREIIEGKPASPEAVAVVKELRARRLNDKGWTARLLAGDAEARRENFLMAVVLSGSDAA